VLNETPALSGARSFLLGDWGKLGLIIFQCKKGVSIPGWLAWGSGFPMNELSQALRSWQHGAQEARCIPN